MAHPADWYGDPLERHKLRYYDGTDWTAHVSDGGVTSIDPVESRLDRLDAFMTVGRDADRARVQQMVRGTNRRGAGIDGDIPAGGGTLFDEPILVVSQTAKVIELNNQYRVMDQHGNPVASVRQHGQSAAKKALRLLTSYDQFMTHKLQVLDNAGQVLLQVTRPRKVFKSTVLVEDPQGTEIGRIVQENVFGKITFTLEAGGQVLGAIKAENWRAWNFRIDDASGTEIARITKTFEGVAKTLFTTADNYVVQLHVKPPQPLHSLVVAAAVSVDTALKQDSRGIG
jgi:uncharacterized protein YxjI